MNLLKTLEELFNTSINSDLNKKKIVLKLEFDECKKCSKCNCVRDSNDQLFMSFSCYHCYCETDFYSLLENKVKEFTIDQEKFENILINLKCELCNDGLFMFD